MHLYLVTDGVRSARVRDWPEGDVGGIPTESHIWDINRFQQVHESKAGRGELEGTGQLETRSHGIDHWSARGRRVSVRSPSTQDSVIGEEYIDRAKESVRQNSVGYLANLYWLGNVNPGPAANPLVNGVHVILVGAKPRINFSAPNSESVVRYVLQRIRAPI